MDRLIAGGSIAVATGALAILFSRLSGPAASILVWTFATIAIAAFASILWSCLSLIPTVRRGLSRR